MKILLDQHDQNYFWNIHLATAKDVKILKCCPEYNITFGKKNK